MSLFAAATDAVWHLVWIFIVAIIVFVVALLLLGVIAKTVSFFTYHYNTLKVQRGELIKKKMFKCSDVYELRWNREIKKDGKVIVLYVHDLVTNRHDVDKVAYYLEQKSDDISVVSYDQRWCGDNEKIADRNWGANLSDLKEIIFDLKERYSSQKLILVGHGFGASLVLMCANEPGVDKVVCVSLMLDQMYRKKFATKMTIFWSWIFSSKSLIRYYFDGADLTDNVDFAKELQKIQETDALITVREYYQSRALLKKAWRKYHKANQKNLVILHPANSVYSNPARFANMVAKLDGTSYNLTVFNEQKHYLLCNNTNDGREALFNIVVATINEANPMK